jgi:hypothetical protein
MEWLIAIAGLVAAYALGWTARGEIQKHAQACAHSIGEVKGYEKGWIACMDHFRGMVTGNKA